jgi:hypothetical protein
MRRAFFFIVVILFATTSFASIPRASMLDPAPPIADGLSETRIRVSDVLAPFEQPAESELTRALRQAYEQSSTTNASGLARFLSVDPGRDWHPKQPQTWNMYTYVRNNPLKYTDPTGREADPGEFTGVNPEAVEFVKSLLHVDTLRNAFSGFSSAPANEKMMAGMIGAIALLDLGSNIVAPEKGAAIGGAEAIGFKTFRAFKRMMGAAGDGKHWHHIVEQTKSNVARFGGQALHNTVNLIKLDAPTHAKISAFYSSKQAFTGGLTVREWLSKKSFKEQYELGQKFMQDIVNGNATR